MFRYSLQEDRKQLHEYVRMNNVNEVKKILKSRENEPWFKELMAPIPHTERPQHIAEWTILEWTPLLQAIMNRSIEMFIVLLKNGHDVNHSIPCYDLKNRCVHIFSYLHFVIRYDSDIDMVKHLLHKNIKLFVMEEVIRNSMMSMVDNKGEKSVRTEMKVMPKSPFHLALLSRNKNRGAIFYELLNGYLQQVKEEVESLGKAMNKSSQNKSPHREVSPEDWLNLFRLVDALAMKDEAGNTVLHIAAMYGDYTTCKLIVHFDSLARKEIAQNNAILKEIEHIDALVYGGGGHDFSNRIQIVKNNKKTPGAVATKFARKYLRRNEMKAVGNPLSEEEWDQVMQDEMFETNYQSRETILKGFIFRYGLDPKIRKKAVSYKGGENRYPWFSLMDFSLPEKSYKSFYKGLNRLHTSESLPDQWDNMKFKIKDMIKEIRDEMQLLSGPLNDKDKLVEIVNIVTTIQITQLQTTINPWLISFSWLMYESVFPQEKDISSRQATIIALIEHVISKGNQSFPIITSSYSNVELDDLKSIARILQDPVIPDVKPLPPISNEEFQGAIEDCEILFMKKLSLENLQRLFEIMLCFPYESPPPKEKFYYFFMLALIERTKEKAIITLNHLIPRAFKLYEAYSFHNDKKRKP